MFHYEQKFNVVNMEKSDHLGFLIIVLLILVSFLPSLTGTRSADVSANLIIGGKNARVAAWPWQVALLRRGRLTCGGTLITTDSVLTAAHCVMGQRSDDLSVILGENNRYYTEGSEQKISVRSASVHPLFKNDYLGGYDLALLYLDRNVSVTSFVRPIPYMAKRRSSFDDSRIKCFITGWGVSSTDYLDKEPCPKSGGPFQNLSPILQEAEIAIINNLKCNSKRYWDGLIKDTNVCAFYKTVAACEGDSGSPLVCRTGRGYVLVGITSWGSISCRNYPTVFTAVAKFRKWIDTTLSEVRASSFTRNYIKDDIQIPQGEEKHI